MAGGAALPGDAFHRTDTASDAEVIVQRVAGNDVVGVATIEEDDCQVPVATPDRSWSLETHAFDPATANLGIQARMREDLHD